MKKIYTIGTETDRKEVLLKAAAILKNGGIAAIPTDTVYGFAACFNSEAAIARLYQIKERSINKSIAVLLADTEQAQQAASLFTPKALRLADRYWPGALTVIVRKKGGLPENLTSNDLVGLRIPDHDFTRALIRLTGPLAVTSANYSGESPAKCVDDFPEELIGKLDIIIDGGPCRGGIPSSVINCSDDPAVILREGAIPGKDLLEC